MTLKLRDNPMNGKVRDLLKAACYPGQYDEKGLDWTKEGLGIKHNPSKANYIAYFSRYKNQIEGARVLDIGCGTGWLLDWMTKQGASYALGIEPSRKNIELARTHYPNVKITHSTLEDMKLKAPFDIVVASFLLGHLAHLHRAFMKFNALMRKNGQLHAMVPDYAYYGQSHEAKKTERYDVGPGEYVVRATTERGPLVEVVRTLERYQAVADGAGLVLLESLAIPPSEEMIQSTPRYEPYREVPICHYLVFAKKNE